MTKPLTAEQVKELEVWLENMIRYALLERTTNKSWIGKANRFGRFQAYTKVREKLESLEVEKA